jgi:hypothetical protein
MLANALWATLTLPPGGDPGENASGHTCVPGRIAHQGRFCLDKVRTSATLQKAVYETHHDPYRRVAT